MALIEGPFESGAVTQPLAILRRLTTPLLALTCSVLSS